MKLLSRYLSLKIKYPHYITKLRCTPLTMNTRMKICLRQLRKWKIGKNVCGSPKLFTISQSSRDTDAISVNIRSKRNNLMKAHFSNCHKNMKRAKHSEECKVQLFKWRKMKIWMWMQHRIQIEKWRLKCIWLTLTLFKNWPRLLHWPWDFRTQGQLWAAELPSFARRIWVRSFNVNIRKTNGKSTC